MNYKTRLFCFLLLFSSLNAQTILDKYNPNQPLTPEQGYDLIKTVWDGLKKLSEEYESHVAVKSEFESTTEFNDRVRKSKDQYINKIRKFSADNKFDEKIYAVWMKADLVKYDADNQIYSVKSPTQFLIQPKKKDIVVTCPGNKYVVATEKNEGGYRRAYIHLNTNPDFSWFVNKVTAQAAKNKEHQIFFKFSFSIEISMNEMEDQIVLQIVPRKLALLDQIENFTYWSEEFR